MGISDATSTAQEIFTPFIASLKAVAIWFFSTTGPFGYVLVFGILAAVIGTVLYKVRGAARPKG